MWQYHTLYFRLNTIAELNSTGSLLSDLNCLSRSEDDLETSNILQSQKKREWKEHRPSSEYSKKHRRTSSLHKTTELNSSDRIVATTTVVMPKDGAITASSTIEAIPGDENVDPQIPMHKSRKRRKSSTEHNKSKLSHMDVNEMPIDIAVHYQIIYNLNVLHLKYIYRILQETIFFFSAISAKS